MSNKQEMNGKAFEFAVLCSVKDILINNGNKIQRLKAHGIDKKNPSKDYSELNNLVPCCHICNWMKGLLGYHQFLDHINAIHSHQCYKLSNEQMATYPQPNDENKLFN